MRRQHQRHTRRAALALIATFGILATVPTTAVWAGSPLAAPPVPAATPGSAAQVTDPIRTQVPLVTAASAIKKAVKSTDATGYAGIGLTDGHVTLWWKGTLPAVVAATVTAARGMAPVTVAPAAYSKVELAQAADSLRATLGEAYAVKQATNGSELLVSVPSAAVSVPTAPLVGVPVRIIREAPLQPTSRDVDTAPWSGGGYLSSFGCTAGFGVRDATGAKYILTAEHCAPNGLGVQAYQNGALVGPVVKTHDPHDILLISTAQAGNTIYTGGINDEIKRVVTGWTEVFPGQVLCQSGRTTAWETGGPRCDLEVLFHYDDEEDLVEAVQTDGLDAAHGGDSGGPVYLPLPDGSVLAAGTTTRTAGARLGFQDFETAYDDWGVEPLTGVVTANCQVTYTITDSWGGGFNANVSIRNTGPAIASWSLGWTFTGSQHINGSWNANTSQNATQVTATNAAHNGTIPTGGSVSFGINASGAPNAPISFTLNGASCS